jgi:enterobactin synthetase component D
MKIELSLNGISCFGTTLPLDSKLSSDFKAWLPEQLVNAAYQRKQEFIAGRFCVYNAAKEIGLELSTLPVGVERGPVWPEGVIGSISHSKKMAIGCVGKVDQLKSIGIDTEEIFSQQTIKDIQKVIALDSEKEMIAREIPEKYTNLAYSILFSAKEALFKAIHPLCKTFIDFQEARMTHLSLEEKTFTIEISEKIDLKDLPRTYKGFYVSYGTNLISVLPINH